jgi:Family of unknown function (DUF5763)
MELGVRVNAASGSEADSTPAVDLEWQPVGLQGEWEGLSRPAPGGSASENPANRAVSKASGAMADQGPCLYFGPAGQRCSRRATTGGFCFQHQPGALRISVPTISPKKLAAIGVAIAMLWPEIVKIASALIRLIR